MSTSTPHFRAAAESVGAAYLGAILNRDRAHSHTEPADVEPVPQIV